jgi:glycosyltransferase involved in cell wall biosynthesis
MAIEPLRHPAPGFVSVIIPVRNGAATISDQLAALTSQDYRGRWQLIVADNGSTDDTRAEVERWTAELPETKVVDASAGRGPGFARNVGARSADGDFLAFCDADDVVSAEWLSALTEVAIHYDIVAGRLDGDALNRGAIARSRPPRSDALPSARGFLPYTPSGNMGVWAAAFEATGGFDEHYSASEDVEWSWRAQLASFSLGFAPDAVVHYRYRTQSRAIAQQAFSRGYDEARLYRDYRSRGLKRPSLLPALRVWGWTVLRMPYLLSTSTRSIWLRRSAEALGRLVGSFRFGVVAP